MSDGRSTVSNVDLVRRAFEALNRHDVGAARKLWSDDALWRVPDRVSRGPREVASYFEEVFTAMPDAHLELIAIADQGSDVFARWHLTGRHAGPFNGIAATGNAIALDGVDHLVVRNGRIVSNTVVFDQLEFARQLGTMPAASSRAERVMKLLVNARTKLLRRRSRS